MHLTGQDGDTPCPFKLQCLKGGERENARERREGQWRKPQKGQAAIELEKDDASSAGLHQGHVSRIEGPETGGSDEETETGAGRGMGLGRAQIGRRR